VFGVVQCDVKRIHFSHGRLSLKGTLFFRGQGGSVLLLLLAIGSVGADFATTTYAVLTSQARGVIPNVSGPIKAKVASNLILSLLFTLNAGSGYVAGSVTATTDAQGRIYKLVKLKQTRTFAYTSSGAASKVTCTTSSRRRNRELEGGASSHEEVMEDQGDEDVSPAVVVHRRRLGTCSSCVNLVKTSFTTRIKAACGTTVSGKISYPGAKAAAAASLCTMGTNNNKLGTPAKLAYTTCRCTCSANAECPSAVCSGGTCVDQKLASGQQCYDYDDADCVTGSCARSTYPSGPAVCCPSGGSEFASSNSDKYCDGQPTGALCDSFTNDMCASGVCSGGHCVANKIGDGLACPDYYDDGDCANNRCARGSYPMGDPVCCPSGDYAYSNAEDEAYCTATQGVGDPCEPLTNAMCTSGVCSEGLCVAQKFGAGDPCPDYDDNDNDCATGFCAGGSYPGGNPVCCSSGYVYSPNQDAYYCTGIQGSGERNVRQRHLFGRLVHRPEDRQWSSVSRLRQQ
jgi:hypothetical protein